MTRAGVLYRPARKPHPGTTDQASADRKAPAHRPGCLFAAYDMPPAICACQPPL